MKILFSCVLCLIVCRASMSFGYDLSAQSTFEQYGGTPRSEFGGQDSQPIYQGKSYDDDDLFSDLLGDDWSAR